MAAMILHEPSAWVTGARYCHRLHDLVNPFEGIPKYQLGEWFHGDDRPDRYSRYALWHDKLFYLPPSSELSLPFGNPLFVSVDIDFTVKRFGFTLLFGEALMPGMDRLYFMTQERSGSLTDIEILGRFREMEGVSNGFESAVTRVCKTSDNLGISIGKVEISVSRVVVRESTRNGRR